MNQIRIMKEFLVDTLGEGEYLLQIHDNDCPPTSVYIEDHGWFEERRGYAVEISDESTENNVTVRMVCEHVERTHKVIGKHTLPSATPDEYDALKLSIATFGVRQPILVDERGKIIDGRLRLRVCQELKIECPRKIVSGLSIVEKRRLGMELDLCRKHIGPQLRKEVAAEMLKRSPMWSDRWVASKCGLDKRTVSEVRETLESGGEIPRLNYRQGKDGKRYKLPKRTPEIQVQKEKDALKAQKVLSELGKETPNKPMELRIAEKALKRAKRKKAAKGNISLPKPTDAIKILHSDFRHLKIADESVDLIFTDPPYLMECLGLWDDLADFAGRVLKPNGLLVTYSGHLYLDKVLYSLGKHLNYRWMISTTWSGDRNRVHCVQVSSSWKPILVYSKGDWIKRNSWSDTYSGSEKQKEYHEWQQNLDEAIYYIRAFSNPGDLICDPFGGGFTSAEAVFQLGDRRFLGCDIEKASVVLGQKRLRKAMKVKTENPR